MKKAISLKYSVLTQGLRRQLLLVVCLMGGSGVVIPSFGQDLHFSQFMHNPLLTNPANTGFNPDFDYRAGASYRNQWWGLPVPYKTMSLWGDVQVFRDKFTNGWMGLGGVLLRDVAGSGNLTSTKGYASIAWHQELGYKSLISAGFNIGMAVKSIDLFSFSWENQWNGKFFDKNLSIGEPLVYSQISYPDLQAGLNYAWFPSDKVYLNAGVSIIHLNRPRESFFSATAAGDNKIPARYTGFVNASIKVNDQWILNPNVYYSRQANSTEWTAGMMAQYSMGDYGGQQVLGGAYLRLNDAAVAMIGLQWNDTRLMLSYDATYSALRAFNNGNGAFEISLIRFGTFAGRQPRQSRCPSF